MSLSDRLKAAEYDRRLAAGLPVDHLPQVAPPAARVDVSQSGAPVVDLTEPWSAGNVIPLASAPTPAGTDLADGNGGVPDGGDGPTLRGTQVGARSRIDCEQCGGPCQIDLIDAVNQTVSLSCLSCFHMFRVDARN